MGPDGGPVHVCLAVEQVAPCSFTHPGTALEGVFLGIVFWPSTFILAFFVWLHTNVPLAQRISEKHRVCDAQKNHREFGDEAEKVTRGIRRRCQVENTNRNTLSHLTVTHSPHPEPNPPHSSQRLPGETGTTCETKNTGVRSTAVFFPMLFNLFLPPFVFLFFGPLPHFLQFSGLAFYDLPRPTTEKNICAWPCILKYR